MILIAMLICFAAEGFWQTLPALRSLEWFDRYEKRLRVRLGHASHWDGPMGVFAVMILPVLVTAYLQHKLADIFVLFGLLFSVAVFAATIRPQKLKELAQSLGESLERGDREKAERYLHEIGGPLAGGTQPARAAIEAILQQVNDRLLAVVFWFFVLGPVGAVLYRFASELEKSCAARDDEWRGYALAAHYFHGVLSWLPARLTALGYAVAGSFVDAVHAWRNQAPVWARDWVMGNDQVLVASGLGALQIDYAALGKEEDLKAAQVNAAVALVWRTLMVWMIAIAMMTLAGWMA